MKTTKITLILFALLTITYSCKKKKIAPTLTLIGESSITLCLGDVFTDPGAESIDAYDDDISADIESIGSVNVDSVGSYTIEYTSTDKNDNVSVLSRTVNVVVCVDNLLGDYSVDDDCGSQLADTHTISAGANNNEIIIDNVSTENNRDNLLDIEKKIIKILETKVRPAVARDGGDIKFKEFKNGVVTVNLQGSCSGCPSSKMTLKQGVQNLLCHYIPEIKEVIAV